jgi:O-antigen chain-terminating methyltransferase
MSPFQVPDGPHTIEKVMDAIRAQVVEPSERTRPPTPPSSGNGENAPADDPARTLRRTLALLARLEQTQPVYAIRSHRPLLGWLIDPFKRLIHWGASPYTEVVRRRQDEINAAVRETLRQIFEYLTPMRQTQQVIDRLDAVDARLRSIEERDRLGDFLENATDERRLAALDASRGTRGDIQQRQKVYLDYFRNLPGQVLDLGCGRGELVAMLRTEGIECWGVDTDPLMVETTRKSGAHALRDDALSALAAVEPGRLGGVFAAQVVEHLYPADLLKLLRLARHALAPGGVMVLETLNPASLGVLAKSYYRDLDHKQPIHPELLKQLAELAGFDPVELHFLHPFRADERGAAFPPAENMDIDSAALRALAERLEAIDAIVFGMQDYYIVARQPQALHPPAGSAPA